MVYESWVKENKTVRVQEVCTPNKNWRGLK